jgi:dihydropteroate synthase
MAKNLAELDPAMPQIMAVLNVTPDSFSDGGAYFSSNKVDTSLLNTRIEQMLAEGATIIDVGGESTRPGAALVSPQQEMDRVLPALECLQQFDVAVSVDTSEPILMAQLTQYDVALINDVRALQREGAVEAAAKTGLPVCLMHMQGEPENMQEKPVYQDVVDEVKAFFNQRIISCEQAGITRQQVLLDPGFGFGKTVAHNAALLARLGEFAEFELPLLVGLSRKSMINHLLGERALNERLPASLALAVMAAERGAWIVRVHDVKESADALKVQALIKQLAS